MTVTRRIFALAVAAVAAFALTGAAAPAQARSLSDCAGSTLTCLWNGKNWSGTPAFTHTMPSTFGACVNVSAINGANNNAESVLNENPFQVSFYDSFGGSGYLFSLAAGAGISDLSVFPGPGSMANKISSICHE